MVLTGKWIGYHDLKSLPIQRGDEVKISKGTLIRTMEPNRKTRVAGKNFTITVHHVLPGETWRLGEVRDGVPNFGGIYWKDLSRFCRRFGIEGVGHGARSIAEDKLLFEKLDATMRLRHEPDEKGRRHMFLHIENPKVCWAGRGGYWNMADINVVKKVPRS